MSTAVDTPVMSSAQAKKALWPLWFIFILSIVGLQAFGLVFNEIGTALHAVHQASLITAIPTIVLGIVCFIYGSLGDFVSLKKMTIIGVGLFILASVVGFALGGQSIWIVIVCRAIQQAGGQVAGTVFLVIAGRYLKDSEKFLYFGIFTAGYQLSTAFGVLAGGWFTQIDWRFLFLIPLLALFVLPVLIPALPDTSDKNVKVDVPGFIIFGAALATLTLMFNYLGSNGKMTLIMLAVTVVLFVIFGLYISKAATPFITPQFFTNTKWLMGTGILLCIYFINYAVTPLAGTVGGAVHKLGAQVSFYLVPAYIVATVFAVSSSKLIEKLGRANTLILSIALMAIGLVFGAFTLHLGMIWVTIALCIYFAGMGAVYSPVMNTVLDTLPKSEVGRGIGMNDLSLNVTGSLGIAIFGSLFGGTALSGINLIGQRDPVASNLSAIFLIFGLIQLLALVIFLATRKMLTPADK